MLTDVKVRPNKFAIRAVWNLSGVNIGEQAEVILPAGSAFIDDDNVIRFFALKREDNKIHGYMLHPIERHPSKTDWIKEFLEQAGLSVVAGQLVRLLPRGSTTPVQIATLIGSIAAKQIIKSFVKHLLFEEKVKLGYHDILTGKLVFADVMNAPENA